VKKINYLIVPADTSIEIKIAKIITETMDGDGMIREIEDFIV